MIVTWNRNICVKLIFLCHYCPESEKENAQIPDLAHYSLLCQYNPLKAGITGKCWDPLWQPGGSTRADFPSEGCCFCPSSGFWWTGSSSFQWSPSRLHASPDWKWSCLPGPAGAAGSFPLKLQLNSFVRKWFESQTLLGLQCFN